MSKITDERIMSLKKMIRYSQEMRAILESLKENMNAKKNITIDQPYQTELTQFIIA